jgi:ABC-2 type transport system permease protein/lipopolysaccharide transport system permease protein
VLRELRGTGDLVRALAERDLRSRYKQAAFGAAWAVVMPLLLMVVSTVFFQRVARQETGPAPYALFSYLGTLPWAFVNSSITSGAGVFISNNSLLNKVYCPREVFPLASIAVALADLLIGTAVLGVLFGVYGYGPTATAIWVPVLFAIQVLFTLGVTFALSGLVVYLRDLRQLVPLVLQVGLLATPVFYGVDRLPEGLARWYGTFNPLVGVIDGYRRTVLYGQAPDWALTGPGAAMAVVYFVGGYVLLKKLESGFADVA